MPVFLDHHAVPRMTQEQIAGVVADIKSGQAHDGIRPLNGFMGATDAWCLIEAPNAQSVHSLHKTQYGLDLGPGDVTEVQTLV